MMRAWAPLTVSARRPRSVSKLSTRSLHSMFARNVVEKNTHSRQTVIKAMAEASTARAGLRRVVGGVPSARSAAAGASSRNFSTGLQQQLTREVAHLEAWFTSKVPKGFEKFYQKNGSKKSTGGAASASTSKGGAKRAKSSSSKASTSGKGGGKKGGGSKKPGAPPPANGMPPMNELLTLGAGAALLFALTMPKGDERGVEIDWQTFKMQLLATGEVERIVVVNKQTAKIVLRSDINVMRNRTTSSSSSSSSNGMDNEVVRDPYMMEPGREDPAASGDTFGTSTGGYSGPTIGARPSSSSSSSSSSSKGGRSNYFFTIGSIESFERKLEITQRELGISTSEFVPVQYANETNWGGELMKFAPTLLIIGLWLFMMKGMGGGMGGMGGGGKMGDIFKIGKSNAKKMVTKSKTTFKDVAGVDEAKLEIMEFVQFLKDPTKFKKLGAKIPKGALLVGPPGTGKTLLAKAVAGEAGVPFFSISGSDFIEMFVGVGPSRVRDLFKEARADAPCIIFIDEIDAVARKRGAGGMGGGGNDERENTLNQLLVEMDGFDSTEGIVVLAGTNRADVLDPAILRPGRFDRTVSVDKPDIKGRRDIFCVHLKGMQLDPLAPIVTQFMESGMDFESATLRAEEDAAAADAEDVKMKAAEVEKMKMEAKEEAKEEEDVLEKSTAEDKTPIPEEERVRATIPEEELAAALFAAKEEEVDEEGEGEGEGGDDDDNEFNPHASEELINFFAERMAALTPGFAGAEIANIVNEAAIIAARDEADSIGLAAFEKAADRVIGGIEKPNKIMTPLEKRTVAYHEAGHAIVGWFTEHASPLLKVTIVPRTSGALGFAQYLPKELNLHTKEQIMDMMCMTLGGRAAEELTFGQVTTGASDDLKKVTQMAYSMVRIYGMCDKIGNVSFPPSDNGQAEFDKPFSDSLAQIMDEEARKIVDEAYLRTKKLLLERSDELIGVAEKLLERETINQDDIIAIVGERPFDSADNYQEILRQSWKREEKKLSKGGIVEEEEEEEHVDPPVMGGPVLASKSR